MAENERSVLMLLTAGFAGSLVSVLSKPSNSVRESALAIVAGTSSAYYLTPLVFAITDVEASSNMQAALAFLLGILGMRVVELIVSRLFPNAKPVDL